MIHMIFFVFVITGLAIAVSSVMIVLKVISPENTTPKGDTMPKTFSKIAYVALIVLMFGIASGWLGAS